MAHKLDPELTANDMRYEPICVWLRYFWSPRLVISLSNKHTCDVCCYLPTMGSRAALDTIRLSDRCLTNASKSGLSIGAPLVAASIEVLEGFFLSLKRDSAQSFQNTQCGAVKTRSIFSNILTTDTLTGELWDVCLCFKSDLWSAAIAMPCVIS